MSDALLDARRYLQERYAALRGFADWQFRETFDASDQDPLWIWQTRDLRQANAHEDANGAAILDPEIGLCLFLQRFAATMPVRSQVSRAIQVKSQLLPDRRPTDVSTDALGPWRVAVHWLVDQENLPSWIKQIADLREKTAHFEEVPVDAVIRNHGSWLDACDEHRFPRLAFEIRTVLAKATKNDVDGWQSADAAVVTEFSKFEDRFEEGLTRDCAILVSGVVSERSSAKEPSSLEPAGEPLDLVDLSIRNFRNIDKLKIDFRVPHETVASTVIQGPNGSGKSSIFEALCIAAGKTSERHLRYLSDPNRQIWGKADQYVTDYLSALGGPNRTPEIGLNGEPPRGIELAPIEEAQDAMADLKSAFLSQQSGQGVVGMTATELGAEIAASFSSVAAAVTEFVDDRHEKARERQAAFNAKWQLRGNVTRTETVIERIASRELAQLLPNLDGIARWLSNDALAALAISDDLTQAEDFLATRQSELEETARAIARAPEEAAAADIIERFLEDTTRRHRHFSTVLEGVSGRVSEWSDGLEDAIDSWGRWLTSVPAETVPPDSRARSELREREATSTRELERVREASQRLSARLDHLRSHAHFLDAWSAENDATCPTCGSDVSDRGGIQSIVTELRRDLERELSVLRDQVELARRELASVSRESAGFEPVPSAVGGPVEQPDIASQVAWLLSDGQDLESIVRGDRSRDSLKSAISHLRRAPLAPSFAPDLRAAAQSTAREIYRVAAEHREVSSLPAAWKDVRQSVLSLLGGVTAQHLPRTLQALWMEITRNMTPAPWQYPGSLGFHVGVRRATPEATVVIQKAQREVLASHILNDAEIHNLVLGWHLTKYLTAGRFRYRFFVLDDPAHSMDQPTFRDLCRLLETILRLHRTKKMRLSTVILLHQDSRALDAARATDAVLHILRWNMGTPLRMRRLKLHGEQSSAPHPAGVLQVG